MLTVGSQLVSRLNLNAMIEQAAEEGIEHFPPLASDECIAHSSETIVKYLAAKLDQGYVVPGEIIGYPRRRFGIRPVAISSLAGRSLYRALTTKVAKTLPEPSRGDDNWKRHKIFGLTSEAEYAIETDIASCYEYIDHSILLEELVLQSMDAVTATAIVSYLTELHGRQFGLPQLSQQSDLLADTYLDILARKLRRDGLEVSRFADDFRIMVKKHGDTNRIIERFADYARELGLVPSTEKTNYVRRETLERRNRNETEVVEHYFEPDVEVGNAAQVMLMSLYGDDQEELEGDEFQPYWDILHDFLETLNPFSENNVFSTEALQSLIPSCLAVLRQADEPIPSKSLREIVYDNATRLESVIKYMLWRWTNKQESQTETLEMLTRIQQQSPWTKLWLIHAVRKMTEWFSPSADSVLDWLGNQLDDRHELVRGEAAWALVVLNSVPYMRLLSMYQTATELTRPLLAAAISRCDGVPAQVASAVADDSPLAKESIKWASKQRA